MILFFLAISKIKTEQEQDKTQTESAAHTSDISTLEQSESKQHMVQKLYARDVMNNFFNQQHSQQASDDKPESLVAKKSESEIDALKKRKDDTKKPGLETFLYFKKDLSVLNLHLCLDQLMKKGLINKRTRYLVNVLNDVIIKAVQGAISKDDKKFNDFLEVLKKSEVCNELMLKKIRTMYETSL